MNLSKLVLVLICSVTVACGRANDLPAMRTEAEGIVKNYAARFEDLNRRAEAILQRGNALRVSDPDGQAASRLFGAAKSRLDEMRNLVTTAGAKITAASKDRLAMRELTDKLAREMRDAHTTINADFDAVESWMASAEARPQQISRAPDAKAAPPVVPPPPPSEVPPPGQPGQQGAGGTVPAPPR
jgi:hypothetical protein